MFIRDVLLNNIGESLKDCLYYRANKDTAYNEGFQEFLDRSKKYSNNGIEYDVHENVNMYLDVTGRCTGSCKFCIAKTTYSRDTIAPNDYINKFIIAYSNLKSLNPSIQIVGGEPTIWEGLPRLLDVIKTLGCRFPVIGTNGWGLPGLINQLNFSAIQWINLSRHHYNDTENYSIMGNKVLSNHDLRNCTYLLKVPIRLQCNMIGGFIDTYGEVMQMISYAYHVHGIKNIVFALLTPLPEGTIYQDKIIKYVKEHPVDCDAILNQIGKDSRFRFEKYRGGVACYYEIWKYTGYDKPVTVVFKYSDNKYLDKADRIKTCIPDIVMHTDGRVCGSWDKNIKELIF